MHPYSQGADWRTEKFPVDWTGPLPTWELLPLLWSPQAKERCGHESHHSESEHQKRRCPVQSHPAQHKKGHTQPIFLPCLDNTGLGIVRDAPGHTSHATHLDEPLCSTVPAPSPAAQPDKLCLWQPGVLSPPGDRARVAWEQDLLQGYSPLLQSFSATP